ncbi:MAG: carboxypeptidase-like regulatory domain-containing protein [Planctomycetaceae bacterium]|jgi:hypothetical protein|nr:carboxypeptidase-like regulatory domain-containing protein [Planctomycetaceae bacterium]
MFRFLFLWIASIVLIIGCQRGPSLPSDIPPLTVCKIIVTQNGEPVDGVSVSLLPVTKTENWRTSGVTDANGTTVPFTNGLFEGVPQGKYKIVVSKTERESDKNIPPTPPMGTPDYEEWMKKYFGKKNIVTTYSLIEKQYISFSTTPHEIEVSGKKTIETTIDVGKKVREKLIP